MRSIEWCHFQWHTMVPFPSTDEFLVYNVVVMCVLKCQKIFFVAFWICGIACLIVLLTLIIFMCLKHV